MTITELLDSIKSLDLVLPEFQREYVWEKEQGKQLLVSLFKGYPTGSLLFWKTDNPPEIKNMEIPKEKIGTTQVILDGQQRLTTLYLLIKNDIPPYYKEHDIKNDPRNLYFNMETEDFQYYQASRMKNNPVWVAVTDCFSPDSEIDILKIAQEIEPIASLTLGDLHSITTTGKPFRNNTISGMMWCSVPRIRTLNWQTAIKQLLSRCLKSTKRTVGLFSPVSRFSLTLVFSSSKLKTWRLFWMRSVPGKLAVSCLTTSST